MTAARLYKRLIAAALLIVLSMNIHAQNEVCKADSLKLRIFFEVSSSEIKPNFSGNAASIREFSDKYTQLSNKDSIRIERIVFHSFTSPEGSKDINSRIRQERNTEVLAWFKENLGSRTSNIEQITNELPSSESYSFQRRCDVTVHYAVLSTPKKAPSPKPAEPEHVIKETATSVSDPEEPQGQPAYIPLERVYRINTNLLYDALAIANIGAEFGFKHHWTVGFMLTFSLWDYGRPNLKFRNLLLIPEARYYFSNDFKHHFVGVYGNLGWYNMAFGGKTRYQDTDARTPLLGAGVEYGYVLPFAKHWGAEFSLGLGYAHLNHDKFYNIDNGALFGREAKNYFGPTKLNLSIFYQF